MMRSFDLRVVGGDDHVARLGDECLPHRTALVGSHGNVLQVRIRTRQTPRHGDGLTEGRVHAAVLRVDHARELVEIGALELRETTVLENEAFVAESGNVIISADYSQIELRIMAHLSQDKGLLDAFARGALSQASTAIMAFLMRSAAVPCMGALMAARSAAA